MIKIVAIAKEIAKKVYYTNTMLRIRRRVGPWRTRKDRKLVISSQVLDGFNYRDSLMHEVCSFFNISKKEVLQEMDNREAIKKDWFKKRRLLKSEIAEFYENESYLFADLLKSKINGSGFLGVRRVVGSLELALEFRKELGTEYLDYGSGIGFCPVLFGKWGFNVSVADISKLMLSFTGFRLKNRDIPFKSYNLQFDTLPQDYFSFITCYDVLEHAPDPIDIIDKIRASLKKGGIVFLYFAFGITEDNPTHIIADNSCINHVKKMGFQELTKERDKIMRNRSHFFIFKKMG